MKEEGQKKSDNGGCAILYFYENAEMVDYTLRLKLRDLGEGEIEMAIASDVVGVFINVNTERVIYRWKDMERSSGKTYMP
jgi:hypothetical protein